MRFLPADLPYLSVSRQRSMLKGELRFNERGRSPQPASSRWIKTVKKFQTNLWSFLVSEDGPTAVEYAIMLALIIVVCIATIGVLGTNTRDSFNPVVNVLAP